MKELSDIDLGSFRVEEVGNYSVLYVVMKTGENKYEWVVIKDTTPQE